MDNLSGRKRKAARRDARGSTQKLDDSNEYAILQAGPSSTHLDSCLAVIPGSAENVENIELHSTSLSLPEKGSGITFNQDPITIVPRASSRATSTTLSTPKASPDQKSAAKEDTADPHVIAQEAVRLRTQPYQIRNELASYGVVSLQETFMDETPPVLFEKTPAATLYSSNENLIVCGEQQELITPINADVGLSSCQWEDFLVNTESEARAGRQHDSSVEVNEIELAERLESAPETSREPVEGEPSSQTGSPLNESPLYFTSDITLNDSLIAVLSYASSCRLSGADFCKLLDLLHILLPKPNKLPTSRHLFFSQFKTDQKELQVYYYCATCWKRRSSAYDKCDICPNGKINFYITCSLEAQITAILERPGMREKLNHKHNRTKINVDNIEDVYDSDIYKQAEQSFLMDGDNISLTWYTDGVALFESGEFSLWPFVFVINELPLSERFKIENLIIGGIWGDKCKPHPNVFTLPIYKEVSVLKTGFNVLFHGSHEPTLVKCIVLFGVCDTPAKAAFLNLKGHSGYCSCPKCFVVGEKSKRTGNVMVFPYQDILEYRDIPSYNDLVTKSIENSATNAATNVLLKGVNGPTIISYMMYSSIFTGVSIDSLHSLHLGLTKQILTLLFDQSYSSEPFSLHSEADEINNRLKNLELPHFVQRLPENVTKLSHWKGSLCRNFLLYFMLPILQDKMRQDQFQNLELVVKGVSLLNQQSISAEDLCESDKLLNQFCLGFQEIYGLRHMSSNIHLLQHLSRSVQETGPLFVTSAYKFEELNGKMASLVHGTTQATKQIFSNMTLATKLPILVESIQSASVQSYCRKLIKRSNQLPFSQKIGPGIFVVGALDVVSRHAGVIKELLPVQVSEPIQFRTFPRLYKNGMLFVSASYKKGSRVSYYCKYKIPQGTVHGKLLTFVKTTNPAKYFALISRSDRIPSELYRFCVFSNVHNSKDLISLEHLLSVSFCVQINGNLPLLVDPLNTFELE